MGEVTQAGGGAPLAGDPGAWMPCSDLATRVVTSRAILGPRRLEAWLGGQQGGGVDVGRSADAPQLWGMGMREGAPREDAGVEGRHFMLFNARGPGVGKLRLHLPHGLVGVILSLFHRRRRPIEGFGNLFKDTPPMQRT